MESNNVVIDGCSVVSSIGDNLKQLRHNLKNGVTGITLNGNYPFKRIFKKYRDSTKRPVVGALINRNYDNTNDNYNELKFRKDEIDLAFDKLIHNSSLSKDELKQSDLLLGTLLGGEDNFGEKYLNPNIDVETYDMLGDSYTKYIENKYGITGRIITFSSACSSSANALSYGYDLIKSGYSNTVIVAGIDFFSFLTYFGFSGLRSIDDDFCIPFNDKRSGITLGEAVTFIVLRKEKKMIKKKLKFYQNQQEMMDITLLVQNLMVLMK